MGMLQDRLYFNDLYDFSTDLVFVLFIPHAYGFVRMTLHIIHISFSFLALGGRLLGFLRFAFPCRSLVDVDPSPTAIEQLSLVGTKTNHTSKRIFISN